MSIISLSVPTNESVAGDDDEKDLEKGMSANELSFYKVTMAIEDTAQKTTNYIKRNARNRVWIPRDANIRSNSEFR